MEATTIIELAAPDEHAYTLTGLAREAREQHGLVKDREIAEWILETEPYFWERLDRAERLRMLSDAVHASGGASKGTRHDALVGAWGTVELADGSRESVMRITAHGALGWSSTWADVGGKETRDLDANDIAIIVRQYGRRKTELRARQVWLLALRDLMRKHRCKTAGGLEDKEVPLPSVEVREDETGK